jgi:KDO2-lipid IV(A) lauroyltransferase
MSIGKSIGYIFKLFAKRRRQIAKINLDLCFPELSKKQRALLLNKHFASLGMGLIETVFAWWASDKQIAKIGKIEGLENLDNTLNANHGVILLTAHFNTLEIATRIFIRCKTDIHFTYRPHENPVLEYMILKQRVPRTEKAIPRDSVREMIKSLKNKKILWFAPDQNYGHKSSVFANFFNTPAATTIATSRLAKLGNAKVVPLSMERIVNKNKYSYKVVLHKSLDNFPSGNDKKDAECINAFFERAIKVVPEQYLWVHRRFKDIPATTKKRY